MNNPFSFSFGLKPELYINRTLSTDEILQTFNADNPSTHAYLIAGVRGAGKTVMLSDICERLGDGEKWIVIELNPERDMLNAFAAKLHSVPALKPLFLKAKLDLSLLGIGVSVKDGFQISDVEAALEQMLKVTSQAGYRVLLAVDEAANTSHMRELAAAFQILVRKKHALFLLMTGLYSNITALQNEKTLTFLIRTPKIMLDPLNIMMITSQYMKVFSVSRDFAQKMAILTKGYAFAFQTLGYLTWNTFGEKISEDYEEYLKMILPEYDLRLQEYVYSKLWSELSPREREIMCVIAENGFSEIQEIRGFLGMEANEFGVYRDRLIKKGVLYSAQRGSVEFLLPRFGEFIRETVVFNR